MPSHNGETHETVSTDMIDLVAKKAGPDAVFGEPVLVGDVALIPVVTVSYGGGGGSGYGSGEMEDADPAAEPAGHGEGGGGGFGFGVRARPVGTVEVTPGSVTYTPVIDWSQLAAIWSWITGAALLALVLRLAFGKR